MENKENIKFCVCAMIDLIGFSSHLELSHYDLRTNIGQQAVTRLENLEQIIFELHSERNEFDNYYPKHYEIQRINDAIFLTMDLDEILIPSVGETSFQGITLENIQKYFTKEIDITYEDTQNAYYEIMNKAIEPLIQFLGIISRIHISINKKEVRGFFPGAKTVISTGYRKPFVSKSLDKEDEFSVNFAFANTYIAEQALHGPNFYVDNGALQIISFNKFAKNVLKLGHYNFKRPSFSCFEKYSDNFHIPLKPEIAKSFDLKLFRKDFVFRQMNPSPLTYLQNIPLLMPYFEGKKKPNFSNIFFRHIYNAIKYSIQTKNENNTQPPYSFIFNGTNDLNKKIGIFQEFIETGVSRTREEFEEKEFNEKYANYSEKGKEKIKEMLDEEVNIKSEKIRIEENLDTFFQFSEESIISLLPFCEGDINLLDYSYNKKEDEE